jgi:hypothetical protein
MFHAINARLARLARRTLARLGPDRELATRYGWQIQKVGFGKYQYRDPRFNQLASRPAAVLAEDEFARYLGHRGGRS